MKKSLLLLSLCAGSMFGFAQQNSKIAARQAIPNPHLNRELPANYEEKSLLCVDTVRYAYLKEQLYGSGDLFFFPIWNIDAEAITETFLLSGGSISISGAEVYAAKGSGGAATVTLRARLFTVDASYNPVTQLATGSVTVSATTPGMRYVSFGTPVTVTGNYAIVVDANNTNGRLNVVTNDTLVSPYDELLSRVKSNYYANSAGSYVNITTLSTGDLTNWPYGAHLWEPVISPIISYNIATSGSVTPTPACEGTPVTFTNTTTPTGILSNKMYNYNALQSAFGGAASDSTYAWNHGNSTPISWSGNHTYSYPAAGTYNATLFTLGGFWNSCLDNAVFPITINPTPAAPTVTPGGPTSFCPGGSVVLTSSAATGNTWSNGATTQSITVNAAGSYTVTATAAGCVSPNSASTTITVNPLDDATFTYPSNAICDASPNQTPTTSVAGTFSATPAGLVFANTATGEIDVAGSTAGSYSVTYNTSGACPATSNQTVVISGAPDASFTYAQTSYCTNGTNPSPVYGAGASAGAFSSTSGLVINASTGIIDLASSNAGTYTVTNTIAANGSCPADAQTFSVTIAATPTAAVSGGGTQCGAGSLPVNVALTGAGPWDITYSDGTTPTTVTGVTASPYVITATANGTYTVSNVTMGGCSAAGTGTASVVFNTNPTVTFTPVGNVCDNASPVTLTASPAGGTFSGSTGVSGSTFDPSGLTPGSITLTYNYTDANGCMGSATSTFTLNAAPTATLAAFADVCLQDPSFGLTGGLPAGGTYSGPGVSGGNFNPATAGVGSQTITYTVTSNGCSGVTSQDITVEDCAGIEEMVNFGLEVYPNPASSVVVIKTGKDVTFSMISEDGKIVYPASSLSMNTETQLEVSHLAKGIYFLHFNNAQGSMVEKVIVR